MSERLERLINLTATLLATRRPLTLDELADRLEPGYPDDLDRAAAPVRARQGDPARPRRADRGRDRRLVRAASSAIASGPTTTTCRTRASTPASVRRCTSRSPRSTSAERSTRSTRCASSAGPKGRAPGRRSPTFELTPAPRRPLRSGGSPRGRVVPVPGRDPPPRAVRDPAPVRPLVRGRATTATGTAPRAFRVDRLDGPPEIGPPDGFVRPSRRRPQRLPLVGPAHVRRRPADRGPGSWSTRPRAVARSRRARRRRRSTKPRPDGSVVVTLDVVNRDAFRTFVLELLDHAEVLDPPSCAPSSSSG